MPADKKGGIRYVICDECGETNKAGTEFCVFCGAFLGWQEQANPPGANDLTQVLPAVNASGPAVPASEPISPLSGPPRVTQSTAPAAVPQLTRASADAAPAPGPRHQATPVDPVTRAAPPAPPPPPGCPSCGRPIDAGRRFCGHCGEQFIRPGTNAPVTRPAAKRDTWWTRLWDSKDRVARRAYRRSLPPLYRWRRVIIAVIALGLVGTGLTVIGGSSPRRFVIARYHDVKNTIVDVAGVSPSIIPPEATAPDTTPEALVDRTAKPWLTTWTASTQGSRCNVRPTTAVIQLSFPATRIKTIRMRAGMLKKYGRTTQFRPKTIWIAYANTCIERTLADVEDQTIAVDTKKQVTSVRISVITAYEPDPPEGAVNLVGFTEITLRGRPPVT